MNAFQLLLNLLWWLGKGTAAAAGTGWASLGNEAGHTFTKYPELGRFFARKFSDTLGLKILGVDLFENGAKDS